MTEEESRIDASIREQKKRMMGGFQKPRLEPDRYQLVEIATGVVARRLKPGMEQGEPQHSLCATCFEDNKRSFLQPGLRMQGMDTLHCIRCNATLFVSRHTRHDRPADTMKDAYQDEEDNWQ